MLEYVNHFKSKLIFSVNRKKGLADLCPVVKFNKTASSNQWIFFLLSKKERKKEGYQKRKKEKRKKRKKRKIKEKKNDSNPLNHTL